ncbi:MAG: hypothetical protein HND49_19970 [Planctomycetes bacterium]|nr:hypothetical protein [Planctomycetota bacterium]
MTKITIRRQELKGCLSLKEARDQICEPTCLLSACRRTGRQKGHIRISFLASSHNITKLGGCGSR